MKPPITYYGGKQRLSKRIVAILSTIRHSVYVEPYAGGAAVLFAKPISPNEIINDTSDRLITFYRVAKTRPDELKRKLESTLYSERHFRQAKSILRSHQDFDEMEIAWAYFVSINCGFGAKLNDSWKRSRTTQNSARTWAAKIDRLPDCLARLRNVSVSCEDAIACIRRFDTPQTLFYCDPPYPNFNQGHYSGWTVTDWKTLCNALDSIQGRYVLSNYDQEHHPRSASELIKIPSRVSVGHAKDPRNEIIWVKR